MLKKIEAVARSLRLQPIVVAVRSRGDFGNAFAQISSAQVDAVFVSETMTPAARRQIVDFAAKHRQPAMFTNRDDVAEGGLMSYAPDFSEAFRRAAEYVDKILKGSDEIRPDHRSQNRQSARPDDSAVAAAASGSGHRVNRRAFLAGLGAVVAITKPLAAEAQQAARVYRIGFLGTTSPQSHGAFVDAFRAGLRDRGYVEGKNLIIEYRWAESDYARLPALAAELVRDGVDLILTHGTPGGRAVKAATTTIPIVVTIAGDAVATGLVQSLAHPGGNLTGSTFSFPEMNTKRIEMLKEALPAAKRVAVLLNESNRGNVVTVDAMTTTARGVGIDIVQIVARTVEDLDGAFQQIMRQRCDAVVLYEDPLFIAEATRLAHLANRQRVPSVGFREYAEAGGLLGFGVDFPDAWRRAAGFVDRIFKGAKPSELPMEQAGKFETVVNLRTAKRLKITIPSKMLLRAETVIE